MRLLFFLYCVCAAATAFAQHNFAGKIVDESGAPVAGASVFLNTTSIGTYSAADGSFALSVPQGRYDLVVSSVGYQTHSQSISNQNLQFLTIVLKVKAKELEGVTVNAFDPDGWRNWGRFFVENFIGTTSISNSCKLKNPQVLKFRHDKKKGVLTAIATQPLHIENPALGYSITYQLEEFMFNFNNRYVFFMGYPLFKPHEGSTARQQRWDRRRRENYSGSLQHFMRSLYRNTLLEEGFEVRRLKKVENEERKRVSHLYRTRIAGAQQLRINIGADSNTYYNQVLQQPKTISMVERTPVPGDSIAYAIDSVTAALDFPDYLLVTYTKGEASPDYKRYNRDGGASQTSELTLLHKKPLEVYANGSFFAPDNLLTSGYWGWREKLGNMLPYDYKLPELKTKAARR